MDNKRNEGSAGRERRACAFCGHKFAPTVEWQKYCLPACRMAAFRRRHPKISPEILRDIAELKKDNAAMKKILNLR